MRPNTQVTISFQANRFPAYQDADCHIQMSITSPGHVDLVTMGSIPPPNADERNAKGVRHLNDVWKASPKQDSHLPATNHSPVLSPKPGRVRGAMDADVV